MAEYIDRKAIKYETWAVGPLCEPLMVVRKRTIDNIPAADVAPVVHGQWLDDVDYMFCSICGVQWNYCDNDTETFNYCPYCGAKMDLK